MQPWFFPVVYRQTGTKPATVLSELVQAVVWQVATEFPTFRIIYMIDLVDIKRDIDTLGDRLGKTQDYL
jgi:hypothetical protein